MNIVFFTMSMKRGGAERVIAELTDYLTGKGETVTIVSCLKAKTEFPLHKNTSYMTLDDKTEQQYQKKPVRFFRRRKQLRKMLDNLKPAIVISFLPEPSMILLSLGISKKYYVIVSERLNPYRQYNFIVYRLLIKILYARSDGFVFQTEGAREFFNKSVQKKSVIIPNPISKEFIGKDPVCKRRKEIVTVGRLTEEKNHKLLIKAFSAVSKKFESYTLLIYGEGNLHNILENYIEELGVKGRVILKGETRQVAQKIKNASLFVLSSQSEGMPNSLMEAMSLGIPIIATDCAPGGARALVRSGVNGVLVENKNESELIKAIEILLSDPEYAESLGRNGAKIVEEFNPEAICKKWDAYINTILEGRIK